VEGAEGVGKSTATSRLAEDLDATLFHFTPEFLRFREEAELDLRFEPLPRLAFYLAATLHLSDLVRAELATRSVVCDRYAASPIALLRSLGALDDADIRRAWEPFSGYVLRPDLTILLTCEHAVAAARLQARATHDTPLTPLEERFLSSPPLHDRFQAAFREELDRNGTWAELDTTGLDASRTRRAVLDLARTAFGHAMA
jgi:thymidylate kinase